MLQTTKERIKNAFYFTFIPLVLVASAAVLVINSNASDVNSRTGIAIVDYLDCVGHIKTPVGQRTQVDYDKCLDIMRKEVRGE